MAEISLSDLWEKGHPLEERAPDNMNEIEALIHDAKLDEAIIKINEALLKHPTEINLILKLLQTYGARHDYKSSIKVCIRAMRLVKDYPQFSFNLVFVLLKDKKYKMGLTTFLDLLERKNQDFLQKTNNVFWRGESLNGKTFKIIADCGHGDHINFFPYVDKLLTLYDCKIYYQCRPALKEMFENSYRHERLIYYVEDDEAPLTDFCNTTIGSYFLWILTQRINWVEIGWSTPYLKPTQDSISFWSSKIKSSQKPKIGLCWAGNEENNNDANRSLPLKELAQSLAVLKDQFDFYALGVKKSPKWEQGIDDLPIPLTDYRDEVKSMSDTAAMMQQMDYIISVDTAEVHLAGAMGLKTFLLLPYDVCWRWPLQGDKTGFYESVSIVRQKAFKNWDGALQELSEKLLSL
jgi:tetratricopeptide (TPR) repeat protein